MGLARDLVELEARLREHAQVDLFLPTKQGGLLSVPEAASMLPRIALSALVCPADVLRLCLQALRIQHEEVKPHIFDAELVATLPPDTPGLARPTDRVMHEMVQRATKEVVLLGYELTDKEMMRLLSDASLRGVNVIMICDRGRGAAKRVLDGWPSGMARPRVFHDKERADGAPYASMHAKCLLVDGRDLLVTSANFTFHGLHGNIEVGVRLAGAPAAEARKIFSHLVEHCVVEEVQ